MKKALRLVLKIQLLTAQRRGEVIGATQAEFDMNDRTWTIPAERSKNGKPHNVPLSPLVAELVTEALELAGPSPWLFPSPSSKGPIFTESVNHALSKSLPAMGLTNVVPHDLRRTAASGMTALGVSRLVVGKVLNHSERGVTSIYDRHSYAAEKRHALEVWAAHLEDILAGKQRSNVVRLAAGSEPA